MRAEGETKTDAIVVGAMPYGESDLIVTFLTREQGVVRGIAKGALRSRKRFAGCFEPFTHLRLGVRIRESGGLSPVVSADIAGLLLGIRSSMDRIAAGAVMLECSALFTPPGTERGEAFGLLEESLKILENSDYPLGVCAVFLVKLLEVAGLGIPCDSCGRCGGDIAGKTAVYAGGHALLCARCGAGGGLAIRPGVTALIRQAKKVGMGRAARLRVASGLEGELLLFLKGYVAAAAGGMPKSLEKLGQWFKNP